MKSLRIRVIAALLWLVSCAPAFAAASTAQNIEINSQVVFGLQSAFPNMLFQYKEPSTTTAQMQGSTIVLIPANSVDNAVNLATLFPGFNMPLIFGVAEVTSPSRALNIGLSAGGPRINLAATGFMLWRANGAFNTLYVDNASLTEPALLRVFGMGN